MVSHGCIKFLYFCIFQNHHPDIAIEATATKEPPQQQSSMKDHFTSTASSKPEPKWGPKDPCQVELDQLLVNFIAGSLQPLCRVEDPDFIALINKAAPGYTIPSRKHLSYTLLPNRKQVVRDEITNHLSALPPRSVCTTTDLWTNNQQSAYIGITAHFIDENFKLQSIMLTCTRITGSHTAENIKSTFDEIINNFNLEGKVFTIVTDSASNMIKAFVTLPGYEEETVEEEDEDLQHIEASPLMDQLPAHIRCFLHTLQNAVKDGLQKTGAARTVIAKASKLVTHVRHSTHATEILGTEAKLQQKNATRWNSSNKMIKSVLKTNQEKLAQVNAPVTLTKQDHKTMKDITDALTPFEETTAQCEGQHSITSSSVIPLIICLRAELQELLQKHKTDLLTTLISSVDRRLTIYEEHPVFQLATILDPRYKLSWCQEDQQQPATDLLTAKFNELSPPSTASTPSSPPKKKSKLLRHLPSHRSQPTAAQTTPHEITSYLTAPVMDEDSDPLQFWREHQQQYPTLSQLSRRYLAVPSSSAPVERLFSIAGKTFSKERGRLGDERFEELMFIKCNKHLV